MGWYSKMIMVIWMYGSSDSDSCKSERDAVDPTLDTYTSSQGLDAWQGVVKGVSKVKY